MFDVEVSRTPSGTYTATCRDLHLVCEAATEIEALQRMRSLIFFFLSAPGDVAYVRAASEKAAPLPAECQKLLWIAPKERIH